MNIEKIYKKLGLDFYHFPYNKDNYYTFPRRSGRTTDMIVKVLKLLLENKYVYIICHTKRYGDKLNDLIFDYLLKLKGKKKALKLIKNVSIIGEQESNIRCLFENKYEYVFIDNAVNERGCRCNK